jgi:hypothetical protein
MKKGIFLGAFALAVIMGGIAGCSKESEDLLAAKSGAGGCDTTNVLYSMDVVPILQTNCYECHGSNSNSGSGGIVLEGYTQLRSWAVNGYLLGTITHASGYVAMPYLRPSLPDCEISKIRAWIDQGTKNN